jgi:hypothetical protein
MEGRVRVVKFFSILVLLPLFAFSFSAKVFVSKEAGIVKLSTIAVSGIEFKYEDGTPVPSSVSEPFGDIIGSYFMKYGCSVVERRKLDLLISEKELRMTGLFEESAVPEIAKLTEADYILFGTGKIQGRAAGRSDIILEASLRLIDVQSSRAVMTAEWSGKPVPYTEAARKLGEEIYGELKKKK